MSGGHVTTSIRGVISHVTPPGHSHRDGHGRHSTSACPSTSGARPSLRAIPVVAAAGPCAPPSSYRSPSCSAISYSTTRSCGRHGGRDGVDDGPPPGGPATTR
jgi:hypothetical protein